MPMGKVQLSASTLRKACRPRIGLHSASVHSSRHLIVDGSNVLNAWANLRATARRDRDAARTLLVRTLAPLHDIDGYRLTVVFDGRGSELVVDRPMGRAAVAVVFTPSGMTADDVIEQLAAKTPQACIVATDDRAERETAAAAGAEILTTNDLLALLKRAQVREAAKIAEIQGRAAREWAP